MGASILIADDEHVIADTLVLIFASRGYNATAVYTLEEVERTVRERCPDLLVLDVQFQNSDSLALAQRLRQSGCSILLLSGDQSTAERLQSLEHSGSKPFPILPKPVHPETLLQTVQRMIPERAGEAA